MKTLKSAFICLRHDELITDEREAIISTKFSCPTRHEFLLVESRNIASFFFFGSGYSYGTRTPTYSRYSYESLLRMIITGSITLGKSYLVFNSVFTFQLSNNGNDAGFFSRATSFVRCYWPSDLPCDFSHLSLSTHFK